MLASLLILLKKIYHYDNSLIYQEGSRNLEIIGFEEYYN